MRIELDINLQHLRDVFVRDSGIDVGSLVKRHFDGSQSLVAAAAQSRAKIRFDAFHLIVTVHSVC